MYRHVCRHEGSENRNLPVKARATKMMVNNIVKCRMSRFAALSVPAPCVGMRVGMYADMCADTCVLMQTCADVCADMCANIGLDREICVQTCVQTSV